MELLDRETFLEWMERIMKRFDELKQTAPDIPQRPMLNGEPLLDNLWRRGGVPFTSEDLPALG